MSDQIQNSRENESSDTTLRIASVVEKLSDCILAIHQRLNAFENRLNDIAVTLSKQQIKKTESEFKPSMTRDEFKGCIRDYVEEKCRTGGNVLTRNQFAGVFARSAKLHGFKVSEMINELIEAGDIVVLIHRKPKPGQLTQYYTTENCLMTVPAIKLIVRDSGLIELREYINEGKRIEQREIAIMMAQNAEYEAVRQRSLEHAKQVKFLPDGTPDLSDIMNKP